MVAIRERLQEPSAESRLRQNDVARIPGASPRKVVRWLQERNDPRRETREGILEFLAVLDALSRTVQVQSAYDWLYSPRHALEHRKPAGLLAEGRHREVPGAIDALAEGVFAKSLC